jgi:hypothetical protein
MVYVDGDVELSKVVVPIPQIPLDPQMYQYSQQIEEDIDLVSGVSEYERGAMSEVRRSATEAAMMQDASNARVSDKLSQVEDFIKDIAECVLQLAQQYCRTRTGSRTLRTSLCSSRRNKDRSTS